MKTRNSLISPSPDHNLISLKFNVEHVIQNFRKNGMWEYKDYYKTDVESLSQYVGALERKVAN